MNPLQPSRLWFLSAVALAVCGCRAPETAGITGEACIPGDLHIAPLALPSEPGSGEPLEGISALARAADGALWLVAERQRVLLRLASPGAAPELIPLAGVPEGMDTESIAFLPDGRLALGTEQIAPRTEDAILFASVEPDKVQVQGSVAFSYAPWGIDPSPNRGLEGLTRAGPWLVALSETELGEGSARFGLLGLYHLAEQRWEHTTVPLTSTTGRLAGLSCRASPGGDSLDCHAIERHYSVSRILAFRLSPPLDKVTPARCVRDLAPGIGGRTNLEGILVSETGRVLLVNDNSSDPHEVPTTLLSSEGVSSP